MVTLGWKIHERQRDMKKEVDALIKISDILSYPVGWGE
ncbi:phage tail protein, partial [Salmonella enterica]|nr:phage tail protein [Salmonella enterica]